MANPLTGDFDVVVEFAIPAVNRVLAAMHRIERLLHSAAVHVDDRPSPGSIVNPTIAGSMDAFGEATVDHTQIAPPPRSRGSSPTPVLFPWALDGVVNTDVAGVYEPPVVPSNLQGRAQLQLAPPTVEVPDASGKNLSLRMDIRARYLADPHTDPIAEFVHGELQMTVAVSQIASQTANVVDIDLKADQVQVNFASTWSSQALSAENLAGINHLIRNALKTSFLPSNTTLPENVSSLKVKTMLEMPSAIAILLNMSGVLGASNPDSVDRVFLGSGDDFAFGASKGFIIGAIDFQLQPPQVNRYTVSLNTPTVELQNGKIQLTITGHAESRRSWLPSFDFRVTQDFTLKLVATSPGGPLKTGELLAGGISLEFTTSGIFGWFVNHFLDLFKGDVLNNIIAQRDEVLNPPIEHDTDPQVQVRKRLNVDTNLGDFLNSLLKPPAEKPGVPPPELKAALAYTAVEIQPSGIILRGSLTVPDWPPAHVEFEEVPTTSGSGVVGTETLPEGPDYSALRSWIPGGAIERFEWGYAGQPQPYIDEHKFMLIHPPPAVADSTISGNAVSGFRPLCLTIRGMRLSSSGPVSGQPVSATVCGYNSFPILDGIAVAPDGTLPLVALTHPGPRGLVEVAGHALAKSEGARSGIPNMIVHFADEKTAGHLDVFLQALRGSGRKDALTGVLAVFISEHLAKAPYVEGVTYAEDQDGSWERVFGLKSAAPPLTLVVRPDGKVAWQYQGEINSGTLAAALRQHLTAGGRVPLRVQRSSVRIGQPPPNFLFEYAPGHELTLRKLVGRPFTIIFWKSASRPSIETVHELQRITGKSGREGSVVLAINDGEAVEVAKQAAAENGLSGTAVYDPRREISTAYGVNIWPTIVFVDALGLVRTIRYGRFAGPRDSAPAPSQRTPAQRE